MPRLPINSSRTKNKKIRIFLHAKLIVCGFPKIHSSRLGWNFIKMHSIPRMSMWFLQLTVHNTKFRSLIAGGPAVVRAYFRLDATFPIRLHTMCSLHCGHTAFTNRNASHEYVQNAKRSNVMAYALTLCWTESHIQQVHVCTTVCVPSHTVCDIVTMILSPCSIYAICTVESTNRTIVLPATSHRNWMARPNRKSLCHSRCKY